nr:type II secretion system F family protein [Rhodococcus sp. HNM0569]
MFLGAGALAALPAPTARARLALDTGRRGVDVPWSPVAAAVAVLATVVVAGMWTAVALVLVGATARVRHRRSTAERARRARLTLVEAGLDAVTAELRVGAHPADACDVAADETSTRAGRSTSTAPCSLVVPQAFRAAAARARLGGSAADGFRSAREYPEFDRIAQLWEVADRYGLPLVDLLDTARTDLLGRQRFRQRTEASLAGARATAVVLAALPALGIVLGELMGAHPIAVLTGGGLGGVLLVVGSGLTCAGLMWADRITGQVLQ